MDNAEIIRRLGILLAALAVPVSMGMPMGAAGKEWADLHHELVGHGWHDAADYENALRERMDT